MPSLSSLAVQRVVISALLAVVAGIAGLLFWKSDESRLELVRREARLLFSVDTADARSQHARECVRLAEPLTRISGRVGDTAAWYLIAAAPLAKSAPETAPPSMTRTKEVASADLLVIARMLFNTRQYRHADSLVTALLRRGDGDHEEILRAAIGIRYELGRDEDVLEMCAQLAALRNDDPWPYHVQATVHRNRGHWEHFVDAAERGRELTPESTPASDDDIAALMDGYLHLGRTADARREYDVLSTRSSSLIAAQPLLHARLLIQEGADDEAEEILDNALLKTPDDVEALILKGTLLIGKEQFTDAIPVLDSAVKLSPAAEQAHYQLGQAYARTGETDLAREHLQKHRLLLDAKVKLHALEQLAAEQPHNVEVRRELAESYARIGLTELSNFWNRAAKAAGE